MVCPRIGGTLHEYQWGKVTHRFRKYLAKLLYSAVGWILPILITTPSQSLVCPAPFFCSHALRELMFTSYPDYLGFLSQSWVQHALGVPVNYTGISMVVNQAFGTTADLIQGGQLEAIAYVLESGVKVALLYGDRDYSCNWIGGEQASLEVEYSGTESFKKAGYTPLLSSSGAVGGYVRQYGNFSFSRVFQAGHEGMLRPLTEVNRKWLTSV
jgi:carboxypeptidase C (cathepsin A)